MGRRASAWLVWSLASLSVVMLVASVALYVLARAAQEEASSGLGASRAVIDLLVGVPVLAFPLVGALIASLKERNRRCRCCEQCWL
jgi:ABC-type amino acid transport system permease subunit